MNEAIEFRLRPGVMDAIWKYPLTLTGPTTLLMPIGAQVLDAQVQDETIQLWALVDVDALREIRKFAIHGTGERIRGHAGKYIATVQAPPFAWHVFEIER